MPNPGTRHQIGVVRAGLGIARAWRLATIGDPHGAITRGPRRGTDGRSGPDSAIAVFAWHEAARLGDTEQSRASTGLCATVVLQILQDGTGSRDRADRGDAAGLHAIAERLGAAGFSGAAVDVAEQAQRIVK